MRHASFLQPLPCIPLHLNMPSNSPFFLFLLFFLFEPTTRTRQHPLHPNPNATAPTPSQPKFDGTPLIPDGREPTQLPLDGNPDSHSKLALTGGSLGSWMRGKAGTRGIWRAVPTKERKQGTLKARWQMYEEKILVIMAGDKKPTFLATPVCPKAVAFCYGSDVKSENKERDRVESYETMKNEVGDCNEHATAEENRDSQETPDA